MQQIELIDLNILQERPGRQSSSKYGICHHLRINPELLNPDTSELEVDVPRKYNKPFRTSDPLCNYVMKNIGLIEIENHLQQERQDIAHKIFIKHSNKKFNLNTGIIPNRLDIYENNRSNY